jgi:hypothetical protein
MEVPARAYLAAKNGIRCNLMITGPERIKVMEEFYEITGMQNTTVWAEITRAILDNTTRQENLGIIPGAHAYPRIGLGILKQDIVARFELLDKVVLEQQCVRL